MSQTGTVGGGASGNGAFPITPYVVGPVGLAGYQTVQSAVNQAHTDITNSKVIAASIYVLPGTYTENLTLYTDISISGNMDDPIENFVIINGHHTPPTSGVFSFCNITLESASDVFISAAAGTARLDCVNCNFNINGYVFNLTNWTGIMGISHCIDSSSSNGLINNTSTGVFLLKYSEVGSGSTGATIDGVAIVLHSLIATPMSLGGSNVMSFGYVQFDEEVTINSACQANFNFCSFTTGTASAIDMNSSAGVDINSCYINSSNAITIDGSGAGTLTIGTTDFASPPVFSGLLTLGWSSTYTGPVVSQGDSTLGGIADITTARITGDLGGANATVGFTNVNSETISTGTGTVKMSSTNSANNAAWIKIYIGTTAYWIPAWTTNAP